MKKQSLFQYAVLWHPTTKQAEDGQASKLVVDITSVLASDENAVRTMASRAIPEEYLTQLDQIETKVRPF